MEHKINWGEPTIKKRTHEITVNSLLSPYESKSFSLWCPDNVDSKAILSLINDVLTNIKDYIPNHYEMQGFGFKSARTTHLVIVKSFIDDISKSKRYTFPQYSILDICKVLSDVMGCKIKRVDEYGN